MYIVNFIYLIIYNFTFSFKGLERKLTKLIDIELIIAWLSRKTNNTNIKYKDIYFTFF